MNSNHSTVLKLVVYMINDEKITPAKFSHRVTMLVRSAIQSDYDNIPMARILLDYSIELFKYHEEGEEYDDFMDFVDETVSEYEYMDEHLSDMEK